MHVGENNLTAPHTWLCIGGPLNGMRYQAPRASGFTLTIHGAEDFEYRAVKVMSHDGPVTFWVLAGERANPLTPEAPACQTHK
jgi:hypothetical protein